MHAFAYILIEPPVKILIPKLIIRKNDFIRCDIRSFLRIGIII
jgi:hypothetical protein